jgi:hypothetical protein
MLLPDGQFAKSVPAVIRFYLIDKYDKNQTSHAQMNVGLMKIRRPCRVFGKHDDERTRSWAPFPR